MAATECSWDPPCKGRFVGDTDLGSILEEFDWVGCANFVHGQPCLTAVEEQYANFPPTSCLGELPVLPVLDWDSSVIVFVFPHPSMPVDFPECHFMAPMLIYLQVQILGDDIGIKLLMGSIGQLYGVSCR